ncbi:MAG: phosphoheptose isomerase [archaeon]|nr:phosphoheptose isomerase [archaeon]
MYLIDYMTGANEISAYLVPSCEYDGNNGSPKIHPDLKNFLIDIDGVVCEDIPNEEPERMAGAFEIPGARKQINEWYNEGHIITFFTSRTEKERNVTEAWLEEHGFDYHSIIFGKPRGGNYHYIDDRQIESTQFNGKFGKIVYASKEVPVFE